MQYYWDNKALPTPILTLLYTLFQLFDYFFYIY